jgi:hypothetical protein
MELGGRSSSRHCREESCFRSEIQRLHPPRYQRRTPVFHQERQNRSRRNSQRLSASAFEIVAQKEWEEIIAKNETLSRVLPSACLPCIRLRNSLFGCHCEWRRDDHSRASERPWHWSPSLNSVSERPKCLLLTRAHNMRISLSVSLANSCVFRRIDSLLSGAI